MMIVIPFSATISRPVRISNIERESHSDVLQYSVDCRFLKEIPQNPAVRGNRKLAIVAAAMAAFVALVLLALGAVPASLIGGLIASELRGASDRPVEIGALSRDSFFSYSPLITIHDLRVGQPAWAGKGDFIRLNALSARVSVFDVITGRRGPDRIRIDGLDIALVRDKNGRNNWSAGDGEDDKPLSLSGLLVTNSRFSFKDHKRDLTLAGPVTLDAKNGLQMTGDGTFLNSKASFKFSGGAVAGVDPDADYPFSVSLLSPALDLTGKGKMDGTLNMDRFTASLSARAPTLKNLDKIIEAGLFGTQPINLRATVRHRSKDWHVDQLSGTIGQSRLTARANILSAMGARKLTQRSMPTGSTSMIWLMMPAWHAQPPRPGALVPGSFPTPE
jgi:hypothetical protein